MSIHPFEYKFFTEYHMLSCSIKCTHPLGYTEGRVRFFALVLHSLGQYGSVTLPWSPQGHCGDLPHDISCKNIAVWLLLLCYHGELSPHPIHWMQRKFKGDKTMKSQKHQVIRSISISPDQYLYMYMYVIHKKKWSKWLQ